MSAAIASIPERYFKYNAILSAKMDNALKRVNLIKKELDHSIEPTKSRVLQVQLLSLLHAVWRTAWAKFSPKSRLLKTTQISVSQTIQAEQVLNNLHMWRRIVETEHSQHHNHHRRRHSPPLLEGLKLMNEQPTHLFRRSPYTPPYIYLTGSSTRGRLHDCDDGDDGEKSESELMSEIRVAFLDLAMRDGVYRDDQVGCHLGGCY
ncbi:hypothetical protein BDR26DRAFT_950967 [Obelidium mucronatum]|nr:hypothetical protein BDR26DRAFT_950967 [Obelidium mucronatum]